MAGWSCKSHHAVLARLWGQERGPSPLLLPWTCRIPQEMWFGATSSTHLSSLQRRCTKRCTREGAGAPLQYTGWKGWGGIGSSQSLSLLMAPALLLPKITQQDHTLIAHCPSSVHCPCPQMLATPHTCPRTWPPCLVLLSLLGWGQGHAHSSMSRQERNAGGKHISGSINAIRGRSGCASAGLGTRICLQR